jgi:putative SOS response-associated peptidase YedK
MCGRFFSTLTGDELASEHGLMVRLGLEPRYNIAPTQPVPVVHLDERGSRRLSLMRWGLVPGWAKEVGRALLHNARAETIDEKPSFRGGWRHRRGLVPASGWYEWQALGGKDKQAWALHLGNHAPIAFACVWDVWEGRGEGSWLESFAILTTAAVGPAAAVHDRMPVLIEPADQQAWMAGDGGRPWPLSRFGSSWVDRLQLTPVGPEIGKVTAQGPQLIAPQPAAAGH